jgi:uncharacterized membrane protein YkvA (DUF1232 family)
MELNSNISAVITGGASGLGFTDDATVLATALGLVGMHVKETHRTAARRLLRVPEPVKED